MANLKEKSNQHLNQNGQGLDGLYRGEVRKQMSDGRVKVFVPGVYDPQFEADGMEDFLPNAEVMQPVWAKSINQSGSWGVPDVGAIVYVLFLNHDANYPLVIGTVLNSVPGFGKGCVDMQRQPRGLVRVRHHIHASSGEVSELGSQAILQGDRLDTGNEGTGQAEVLEGCLRQVVEENQVLPLRRGVGSSPLRQMGIRNRQVD